MLFDIDINYRKIKQYISIDSKAGYNIHLHSCIYLSHQKKICPTSLSVLDIKTCPLAIAKPGQ